jgi:hypothetical protein
VLVLQLRLGSKLDNTEMYLFMFYGTRALPNTPSLVVLPLVTLTKRAALTTKASAALLPSHRTH